MKIVFFGTSAFAVPSLETLIKSSHEVACVVTQPDSKKGRHLLPGASPVKVAAVENKIPVLQPQKVGTVSFINELKKYEADVFVVVAYGQLLPSQVLKAPSLMCMNVHASLLPKYRGAAPINWALINGEKKTGVTVIKMVEELDAGPIMLAKETDIHKDEDAKKLGIRLANLGAAAILEAVNLVEENNYSLAEQDSAEASFAPKLEKDQGLIDWKKDPAAIADAVRGLQPWPGTFTYFNKKLIKILESQALEPERSSKPGRICEIKKQEGIVVEAGKGGRLLVQELQPEGGKHMKAYDFALGHQIKAGDILGK